MINFKYVFLVGFEQCHLESQTFMKFLREIVHKQMKPRSLYLVKEAVSQESII